MTKPNDAVTGSQFHGLTKREYFAAMAMQGILANNYKNEEDYVFPVQEAIEYADELICQLNVKQFDSEYADELICQLNVKQFDSEYADYLICQLNLKQFESR